ncbi:tRNA lysidine(34) synthetase TilS [Aquincola sp. MAHUQ-54]|uniref:tRNA(Ile)-lysidine synthase n=1 Tax=Aquincola agrisoli TaxID=3119538 RepID=A0AAW9QDX5_9BURK
MPHRVAVAVSGGRDSVALLHATRQASAALGLEVHALHVHHGLQRAADAWQAHVGLLCEEWQISLHVGRLSGRPQPGDSIEAWARRERYAALAALAGQARASLVLLAHHRRDQAETFLLQALRGAGPAGLASMPRSAVRGGITWARPWLAMPREAIEAYVEQHGLPYVEDDSNGDLRFARNRLRLGVMPALAGAFPAAEAALAASAARSAQADAALREWTAMDLATCAGAGGELCVEPWLALSEARRAMVLRGWVRAQLGQGAPQRLLDRLTTEWPSAAASARWPAVPGWSLCSYRGSLRAVPEAHAGGRPPPPAVAPLSITCAGSVDVPAWGGVLQVFKSEARGVPLGSLHGCELRPRHGGEQFQLEASRPARSLKKAFQAAGVPEWARGGPLLWSGGRLLFVPGLGVDARALALPPDGTPRVSFEWSPSLAGTSKGSAGR